MLPFYLGVLIKSIFSSVSDRQIFMPDLNDSIQFP